LRRAGVVQFSMTRSPTRSNSAVLFVTSVSPSARAWAAISRSLAPISAPALLQMRADLAVVQRGVAGEVAPRSVEQLLSTCASYDLTVQLRDAIDLLADSGVGTLGPTAWADLGCGTGTFTLALADLLAPGSVIHAMDRDRWALRKIPSSHKSVSITIHRGDFTNQVWSFDHLDGILMANSLHYVNEQAAFIRACEARMTSPRRFLVVEYDTHEASRWLPYPVPQTRLTALFTAAGYSSIRLLRSRPSVYRRAALYAAFVTNALLRDDTERSDATLQVSTGHGRRSGSSGISPSTSGPSAWHPCP
jgi:ubiquinone/menaquinone biosynthesis C-methylase UbiE